MTEKSQVPAELIAFAHRLADAARPIPKKYFRKRVDIISKDDDSPVTVADRESEAAMREVIEATYPEHGIYGEEYGIVREDAEYVWVLDPIDGTRAFITGLPVFGTLICLARNGVPVLGVMEQPIMEERWIGAVGHAAQYQKGTGPVQTISVRDTQNLDAAALYLTSPDQLNTDARRAAFDGLYHSVKERRFGGDCYSAGLLAMGMIDLHVECGLQPYDYMALAPIIEAAGGVTCTWDGKPLTISSGDTYIGASTPAIRDAAIAHLKAVA